MPPVTAYYVQIDSNAVKDSVGNYFEGINDKTSWNFETDPAPELASSDPLAPADGTTGVTAGSNLTVTFTENVSAGGGAVKIYDSTDTLFESITVTTGMISAKTVTINPTSDLAAGTAYYVQIDSDAVKDSVDNYFEGISDKTSWSFTTTE